MSTGTTVGELLSDDSLRAYGYLPLSYAAMQAVGSAAQTIGAIRSHWGTRTFADTETIATAACLDEATVRKRHLPKLLASELVGRRRIRSKLGERWEYFLTPRLREAGYFSRKRATLPRWAALSLPEWSQRAVYAHIVQNSRALSNASKKHGPIEIDIESVANGHYGRHTFPLSSLCELTGLGRNAVIDAKRMLLDWGWLVEGDADQARGSELWINLQRIVEEQTLWRASQTTREAMFRRTPAG